MLQNIHETVSFPSLGGAARRVLAARTASIRNSFFMFLGFRFNKGKRKLWCKQIFASLKRNEVTNQEYKKPGSG
jgi:hypothetical protein